MPRTAIEKIKENVDLLYHETTFMQDLEDRMSKTGIAEASVQAATIAQKAKVKKLLLDIILKGTGDSLLKELNQYL